MERNISQIINVDLWKVKIMILKTKKIDLQDVFFCKMFYNMFCKNQWLKVTCFVKNTLFDEFVNIAFCQFFFGI
jgi:hypothetical protein